MKGCLRRKIKPALMWFITALLLSGCARPSVMDTSDLLSQWMGREIRLPDDLCFSRYAAELLPAYSVPPTDYVIMTYIDTTSCFTCQMRLEAWMEFKSRVDSLYPGKVSFLFFFNPGQEESALRRLSARLKDSDFDVPVCLDTTGIVSSMNCFPARSDFHTFLLNSDRRAVAIGNPVMSSKIQDLYLRRVGGVESDSVAFTHLSFSGQMELGEIPVGESKTIKIRITNAGNRIFSLHGLSSSCDCTVASADWSFLKPGKSGTIKVTILSESPGDFLREVYIDGNLREPVCIRLTGKSL